MRGIVASIAKLTLLLPFVALGGADVIGPVNNEIAVQSKQEIINLRAEGPAGLRTLLDAHKAEIAAGPRKDAAWAKLSQAIDAVAGQYDAYASQLYWYTDLDAATAAAVKEGKPILSLRLLGQLDCDLSCANSRYFRTTLYPDKSVSTLLREKFILHWSSERPVPVVTIDFGDGRTLKRTVTGNSVHYVLDADGRPIDALPGLYSGAAFIRGLNDSLALAGQLGNASRAERDALIRRHHAEAGNQVDVAFAADLKRGGLWPNNLSPNNLDDAAWKKLAALHIDEARLRPEVVALVAAKAPPAEAAERLTRSKSIVESPIVRMVRALERSIAEDTMRNEYQLHRQIHTWFAEGQVAGFNGLNTRVYAELFLTPKSDPWLGLAPADGFTGIDNEGLVRK